MTVELMRAFKIQGLTHPESNVYEHGRHTSEAAQITHLLHGSTSHGHQGQEPHSGVQPSTRTEAGTDVPPSRLPAGWRERVDANGRTYYENDETRTTQWERPAMYPAADL